MTSPFTRLPIFPLPDLVFLPETTLPLHVFEPRYRDLLSDALAGEKVIGVQRLKAGPSTDAAGRPELYELGCAGEIVEHEALEDGRSNIVLKGLFRYRIAREVEAGTSYRIAEVTPLAVEPLARAGDDAPSRDDLRRVLTHVVKQLAESVGRVEAGNLPDDLSDEGLVNEASTRLGLDADDRYTLLAMDRLDQRYAWVVAHVASIQKRLDLLAPFRLKDVDPRWN
jgi:uncharacterized protein